MSEQNRKLLTFGLPNGLAYLKPYFVHCNLQEDWSKEAMEAFSAEVQDQGLLMNVEYRIMGQVCFTRLPISVVVYTLGKYIMRNGLCACTH